MPKILYQQVIEEDPRELEKLESVIATFISGAHPNDDALLGGLCL